MAPLPATVVPYMGLAFGMQLVPGPPFVAAPAEHTPQGTAMCARPVWLQPDPPTYAHSSAPEAAEGVVLREQLQMGIVGVLGFRFAHGRQGRAQVHNTGVERPHTRVKVLAPPASTRAHLREEPPEAWQVVGAALHILVVKALRAGKEQVAREGRAILGGGLPGALHKDMLSAPLHGHCCTHAGARLRS